jgi:hypothetical protein
MVHAVIVTRGKRPENDFTMIKNSVLRDERISFRARGIHACIMSYPEGHGVDCDRMAKAGLEGRDAIRTAFKELERYRYLVRTRTQGANGQWQTSVVIYDEPQPMLEADPAPLDWGAFASELREKPTTDFQSSVNQSSEFQPSENQLPEIQSLRTTKLDLQDNHHDDDSAGEDPDEVIAREAEEAAAKADAAKPAKPAKPKAPQIAFTGTGFTNISDGQKAIWANAYRALNIDEELARAVAWLDANPENLKTNYKAFLVRWFARQQDRAPRTAARLAAGPRGGRVPQSDGLGQKNYGESGKI